MTGVTVVNPSQYKEKPKRKECPYCGERTVAPFYKTCSSRSCKMEYAGVTERDIQEWRDGSNYYG